MKGWHGPWLEGGIEGGTRRGRQTFKSNCASCGASNLEALWEACLFQPSLPTETYSCRSLIILQLHSRWCEHIKVSLISGMITACRLMRRELSWGTKMEGWESNVFPKHQPKATISCDCGTLITVFLPHCVKGAKNIPILDAIKCSKLKGVKTKERPLQKMW